MRFLWPKIYYNSIIDKNIKNVNWQRLHWFVCNWLGHKNSSISFVRKIVCKHLNATRKNCLHWEQCTNKFKFKIKEIKRLQVIYCLLIKKKCCQVNAYMHTYVNTAHHYFECFSHIYRLVLSTHKRIASPTAVWSALHLRWC